MYKLCKANETLSITVCQLATKLARAALLLDQSRDMATDWTNCAQRENTNTNKNTEAWRRIRQIVRRGKKKFEYFCPCWAQSKVCIHAKYFEVVCTSIVGSVAQYNFGEKDIHSKYEYIQAHKQIPFPSVRLENVSEKYLYY